MHLLDTDTLTHLHAGHPRVVAHLRNLDDPDVAITIVTRIEVLRGRMDFVLKAATGSQLVRAQELLTRSVHASFFPQSWTCQAHFYAQRYRKIPGLFRP